MVPSADNRPKDAKRLRLQRNAAPRPSARRAKPKKEPLARTNPIPSTILRRKTHMAMAPTEQTRTTGVRKVGRPRKTEREQKTSG